MLRLLFLMLSISWASIACAQQAQYYWVDGQRMNLTASNDHFIITADEADVLASVSMDKRPTYQRWLHKPYATYESDRPMTPAEVIAELGFDTDEVKVSYGYTFSDGFVTYPTRRVVVKLADKNDRPLLDQVLADFPVVNITEKFGTYRIDLKSPEPTFALANRLQESGKVTFAQPDFYAPIERYQINDPLFSQQFQMHNTGQTLDGVTGANDADCNALEAWGISLGSSSITVAVIDDGLEAHEDLRNSSGQSRYTAGFSPANNGNGNAVSGSAHGVSCAGSIAASHNSIGVRGVAPLVNLISVNIFVGGESTQDLADAFTWAKNQGADVMSNSWGYTSCTANFSNVNNAMADANANGRGGLGTIVIFASGNGYKNCVDYPANNSNVVAVGAFSNQGIRSAYSNYGPALDIMAPSNNVGGPGAGVRTTDRMGSPGYNSGNYASDFGGTSSACPVVSGVAALVLGYNPNLTSGQLKNLLYSTAIDMGAAGVDNEYANGRVNALGALQAAGGTGGPTCNDGIQNGQETGIDCGGPDCAACPPVSCNGTEVALSFTFDNYPEETSWTITNGSGQVVESGGTYGGQADGSSLTIDLCLADGCYTLNINDAYGDGICCSYGSGSYSLTEGGTVLASGASFGSVESTDFCLGGGGADTQPPTTPTNLSVSNETETTVDLSWGGSSDNVGVVEYNVYMDGNLLGSVAGTGATISSLSACTTYSFAVTAVDAAGNESGSATASGTTTGCSTGGGGVLGGYFFEGTLEGWQDGGGDCALYSGSYSYEGQGSVRIRDNSGVASSMTSPAFNLSGLGSVEISFYFYSLSMENGEDFWVRYNDGGGWQTVAVYTQGSSYSGDGFYTATVTLDAGSFNLTNGARFRFQCDASGNNDMIYIDQVTVTGFTVANTGGAIATIEPVAGHVRFDEPLLGETDLQVSPNPASDFLNIRADENIESIELFSLEGRLLLQRDIEKSDRSTLQVGDLPSGVYILRVQTVEEIISQRVVIGR